MIGHSRDATLTADIKTNLRSCLNAGRISQMPPCSCTRSPLAFRPITTRDQPTDTPRHAVAALHMTIPHRSRSIYFMFFTS
jgi:hypothetical protein